MSSLCLAWCRRSCYEVFPLYPFGRNNCRVPFRIPGEDLSDGHRLDRKPLGPTKIFMFLMEHSKPVADQLSLSRVLAGLARDLDGYCNR